jgi:hypothetical protein
MQRGGTLAKGAATAREKQRKQHQTNSLCISFVGLPTGSIKAESLASIFSKSLNQD